MRREAQQLYKWGLCLNSLGYIKQTVIRETFEILGAFSGKILNCCSCQANI
ncbi:hypothetical protein APA_2868 [Pseudanabaena sp. lw0831]|nr:hypothetical protein APA_2868 [Pseudanabaena sp. lw0831]